MANVVDFTKLKKEYLTVKLNDEKKTVLMVCTPSKAILNEFTNMNDLIETNNGADSDTVDELFRICARVMSFNKGGVEITSEYLETFFDIEDLTYFFRAYGEFVQGITNSKN